MAFLRTLARLVLVLCVGGLMPPTQPDAAWARSADLAAIAATSLGHLDHLPALPRAHARESSRLEGARKSPHSSAALPVFVAGLPVDRTLPGLSRADARVPRPVERAAHPLRGPPSLI